MRLLITGANGFIGRHVVQAALTAGHEVVAAVRDPARVPNRGSRITAIACDFNTDTSSEIWVPRLEGIDAIINCVGVLRGGRGQSIEAIHRDTPLALFEAAVEAKVARVIHISAISASPGAGTEYAQTKLAAEQGLQELDLAWVILRPSLVYGDSSYGGTSLIRALAACPFVVPLFSGGSQTFQPIHARDVARTAIAAVERREMARITLEPTGPDVMTLKDLIGAYRDWFGLPPARFLNLPRWIVRGAARIGDLFGRGPLSTVSVKQAEFGNTGDADAFEQAIGFRPRKFASALVARPAGTQDLWHARFYLMRPLIRLALAFLWLASGIAGIAGSAGAAQTVLSPFGLFAGVALVLAWTASVVDLAIGAGLLMAWRPRLLGVIQITVVLAYTVVLTLLAPDLWLDVFGPLVKNIPILALIAVWMVIEDER